MPDKKPKWAERLGLHDTSPPSKSEWVMLVIGIIIVAVIWRFG